MTNATQRPPTAKQLRYLRSLAAQRGESFSYPAFAAEASAEIERLKTAAAAATSSAASSVSKSAATWRAAAMRFGREFRDRRLRLGALALSARRDRGPILAAHGRPHRKICRRGGTFCPRRASCR